MRDSYRKRSFAKKGSGDEIIGTTIISDGDAGILGTSRGWRSVRALQDLCVVVCKIMMISPPIDLFRCSTCENGNGRLHAMAALRIADSDVIPRSYLAEPICGESPKNFLNNLGDGVLSRTRGLILKMFQMVVRRGRICHALLKYLKKFNRDKSRKRLSNGKLAENENEITMKKVKLGLARQEISKERDFICWRDNFEENTSLFKRSLKRDLHRLFEVLIPGPATQYITRFASEEPFEGG